MKILNVIQCTNLGGMEQSSLLLMDEWRKWGIECEVISLTPFGELKPLLDARGIHSRDLPYRGRGGWRSFGQARRMLRSIQGDGLLMTGHNLMATLAMGRPTIPHQALFIHFHHRTVKPDWAWRLIYGVAARRFPAIIFASGFIRDEAVSIVPSLEDATKVINCPLPLPDLPTEETRRAARHRLGIASDVPIVGNAGWLIPRKRWDLFFDVAARVAAQIPATRFVVAGDGPDRGELEKRARTLGIQDRIHWLSWQKDLGDFYQSLDVMLFNSDWDALGRTPLEAMAFGVPVVASVTNGGLQEVLNSSKVARFFSTHDIGQLAEAVIDLLQDKSSAQVMGKAGRERIKEVGDPQIHALRVLKAMGFKLSDIPDQSALTAAAKSDFNAF